MTRGALGGSRTRSLPITKRALCQMSFESVTVVVSTITGMKLVAAAAVLPLLLLVTGCTPAPPREEVSERVMIGILAAMQLDEDDIDEQFRTDVGGIADGIADDMLAGKCGMAAARGGLAESPELTYAWDTACLMYFERDMSEAQIRQAKEAIIQQAING
jgi:hypothetical protein